MSELFIAPANKRSKSAGTYPPSHRSDDVDYYHGEAIPDPYRWLEADTPQTAAWVAAQNRLTQAWLDGAPARREIRSRLTRWWDHPRSGVPFERGAAGS